MSEHKKKVRRLWFRAREYGWGWYPISWQGWLITALYAITFTLTLLAFFGWIGAVSEVRLNTRDVIFGVLEFAAALAILSYSLYRICLRFGETPSWRWGKK